MTTYTAPDGSTIELDSTTVADLQALAAITREHTNTIAAEAIERQRQALVPSTKPAAVRAARKAKG